MDNVRVILTSDEMNALNTICSKYSNPYRLVIRAKIILGSSDNKSISTIASELGVSYNVVSKWIERWIYSPEKECAARLKDLPRSGSPDTFTAEQVCKIIAICCEPPIDHGCHITHWTHRELANKVIEKGVVYTISTSEIGRILKEASIRPHKSRYWLNAKADERKDERIADICETYQSALTKPDRLVVSYDEMTGVQALERIAPSSSMREGKIQAIEFEYKRHGTQTLIAGMNVATGEINAACGETRTEADLCDFIEDTIAQHPDYKEYHFAGDQLNTHKSESLVRLVANHCNITDELGEKGKSGILQSMETREDFLSTKGKTVVFHYTPKHASWMNQIEVWFGVLAKKVVKRGSFQSTVELKEKITNFIKYFNETMAKPFKWTYQGKAMTV